MSKHSALTSKWAALTESTRRGLRTALQALATFATLTLAAAVPPVAEALNDVAHLFGVVGDPVSPALMGAVGAVATAFLGIVAKVQNLLERRDILMTPAEAALEVAELTDLVQELTGALVNAHRRGAEAVDLIRGQLLTAHNALPEGSPERDAVSEAMKRAEF